MPDMTPSPNPTEVTERATAVLDAAWDDFRGSSFPHADVYGHQWLWDSCFHAIAWAALDDDRALRELGSVFSAQLPNGFVPHMRYSEPTQYRGPLAHASSFTQPPVYGLAAASIATTGRTVPPPLLAHISHAYDYLWSRRRTADGLLRIVHPWEAGADDSPRWDGWIGHDRWNRPEWTAFDLEAVAAARFAPSGEAIASDIFEAAPAAFNAIAAHGMDALARLSGESVWEDRAAALGAAIDDHLWFDEEGLWSDVALVGSGATVSVPTLDGALGLLTTHDEGKAQRALAQLADPDRFCAPYGLAYVARAHPAYRGDLYWRGAAWPQLNHLARVAAHRWGAHDLADDIAEMSRRGAMTSGFSELWDPETGEARGAVPQTWAALAAVPSAMLR